MHWKVQYHSHRVFWGPQRNTEKKRSFRKKGEKERRNKKGVRSKKGYLFGQDSKKEKK